MKDSLQLLRDSIAILNQMSVNKTVTSESFNYFNLIFGIISVIGVMATLYSLFLWSKDKKLQEIIFRQAKVVLEKESTQEELTLKKDELKSVENQLTQLHKQIEKNLPLEARKAVLKDRLEESLEHLQKYYDDVVSTKTKLESFETSEDIPSELLKNIQDVLEPRFVIKEKISTSKTYLTIISVLSSIMFVTVPYPLGRYAGIAMLLLGIPFIMNIIRLTALKKAPDRQHMKQILALILNIVAIVACFIISTFLWAIYYFSEEKEIVLLFCAIAFLSIAITLLIYNLKRKRNIKQTENNK